MLIYPNFEETKMRQDLEFFRIGARTAGLTGAFFGSSFETSAALSNIVATIPGILSSIRHGNSDPIQFNILGGLVTSLLAGFLHLQIGLPKMFAFLASFFVFTILAGAAEFNLERMEARGPRVAG